MKFTVSIVALCLSMAATTFAAVSTDGSCGGTTGNTCLGSTFGDCCSAWGWCGSSTTHCGTGCQTGFGTCTGGSDTLDGTCGGTNGYHCTTAFGNCCSSSGYCGNTGAHCGAGCQGTFSTDGACLTAGIPSPDGTCGGTSGYTCVGSTWDGSCCSSSGYCGTGTDYCGTGCQPTFGATCSA